MPKEQTTKAKQWLILIEEWQQSHLNKKEFCSRHAINYKNFTKWYSRLIQPQKSGPKIAAKSSSVVSPLFLPVEIKPTEQLNPSSSVKPLVLILNKQLQLQIPIESVDAPLLKILFTSLGALSC